jgi:hypothetical protein
MQTNLQQLTQSTYESTPPFSLKGKRCKGKVLNISTGDTLCIALPVFDQIYAYNARMYGYEFPVIQPLETILNMYVNAERTKGRLEELTLNLDLVDVELLDFDEQGRVWVKLYHNGICINDQLIQEGFAKALF